MWIDLIQLVVISHPLGSVLLCISLESVFFANSTANCFKSTCILVMLYLTEVGIFEGHAHFRSVTTEKQKTPLFLHRYHASTDLHQTSCADRGCLSHFCVLELFGSGLVLGTHWNLWENCLNAAFADKSLICVLNLAKVQTFTYILLAHKTCKVHEYWSRNLPLGRISS